MARIRGRDVAGISSLPPGAPAMPGWTTYVAVQSADAAADRARAAGGTVVVEPFDAPPAGRMAVLSDLGGAVFCV
ncbi:MAG: VOC family protein [Solirubrobacteraceae bacterium]